MEISACNGSPSTGRICVLREEINPPLPSDPSAPYVWPEGSEFAKAALQAICAKLIFNDEAQ